MATNFQRSVGRVSAKPRNIRAWPDLTGIAPLLDGQDMGQRSKGLLSLDFTLVYAIDAIGLAIFLARLAASIQEKRQQPFLVLRPSRVSVATKFHFFDIEKHLVELGLTPSTQPSLFDLAEFNSMATSQHSESDNPYFDEKLICVVPGSSSRDETISRVRKEIKDFLKRDAVRSFSHEQMLLILMEMIKNTIDHSGQPAFLGLRIFRSNSQPKKLEFSYCDTGLGIGKNVRAYLTDISSSSVNASDENQLLTSNEISQIRRLKAKGALADMLYWALGSGNSTKRGNGVNFGLGMMVILEGAKKLGMRLRLKDADSIFTLTELPNPYSHAEIRQVGVATCAEALMMYMGELEFQYA